MDARAHRQQESVKLMCKQEAEAPAVRGHLAILSSCMEVNLIMPTYTKECEQPFVGFALQV